MKHKKKITAAVAALALLVGLLAWPPHMGAQASEGKALGVVLFDTATTAGADILATGWTGDTRGAFLHDELEIMVALNGGNSVFDMTITDGTDTHTLSFNSANALVADRLYTFTASCPATTATGVALTYNFQTASNGTLAILSIYRVGRARK